jgi:hypothetical protein
MSDSTGIRDGQVTEASKVDYNRDLKPTWQRWTGFRGKGSLVGWVLTVGVFALFAVSQMTRLRLQAPGGRYWFEGEKGEWLGFCLRVHVWGSIRKISLIVCFHVMMLI